MTEAKNPISPLCDDSRLEMPDISKLGGVLPFGGVRDAARGQNIPVPGPTPAPNPIKRKPAVSPTAETVRITRAPKLAEGIPSPSFRGRRAVGLPAPVAPIPPLPTNVVRSRARMAGKPVAAPMQKAPAAPVLPQTSVNPSGASQASGGVAAASQQSPHPSPAGVQPAKPGDAAEHALNQGVEVAKGIGYGRAARIGGGLGAAVGVLAPGEEKDENGNVVQKSRIGGALHGALAGAGAGLAGNFAKNRMIGTGLLGNGMPHTTARSNHMAGRAAATPAAAAPGAQVPLPDISQQLKERNNALPTAGGKVGLASAEVPNAEKATDPELNPEASKKLPYKVPSLKLKK